MAEGIFVISLDFELHWGVSDHFSVSDYHGNLSNTHRAIDGMLEIFKQYDIHCTWATVGMLFCKSKEEIFEQVEEAKRPRFSDPLLSNFNHAKEAGNNETEDPYHYALSVIHRISSYPNQEISTHTFSHYYCLEAPIDVESFEADIEAAMRVAEKNNYSIRSIIFPRNQVTDENLRVCAKHNIVCYRGTQPVWFHRPVTQKSEKKIIKRIFRLLDHYVNITGTNGYDLKKMPQPKPVKNIPASRFLRPYSEKLGRIERLRIRRIKHEMTAAAKSGKMYHLWWHPHNFGNNVEKNLAVLNEIAGHYRFLKKRYSMKSLHMLEVYEQFFKS